MEKAILKTLIYADIFDYPLKINEIHKWLIKKKATPRQMESALGRLMQRAKCKVQSEYYFLPGKNGLVAKRWRREKQSVIYFRKAKILSQILKIIPWVKLVGISGGLAMGNANKRDDIDLFIITNKNRLWISRLLALGLISLTGQRRKREDQGRKIAGKICINILLEEDRLVQKNKDIFTAHEVLQMKVLWQRDGMYSKYLSDNAWAFKFLPNWIENRIKNNELRIKHKKHNSLFLLLDAILDYFENLAKWFQLKIMQQPQGNERVEDGALYFHPQDCRLQVLSKYHQKLKKIISP